jgi:hypothetical protein
MQSIEALVVLEPGLATDALFLFSSRAIYGKLIIKWLLEFLNKISATSWLVNFFPKKLLMCNDSQGLASNNCLQLKVIKSAWHHKRRL